MAKPILLHFVRRPIRTCAARIRTIMTIMTLFMPLESPVALAHGSLYTTASVTPSSEVNAGQAGTPLTLRVAKKIAPVESPLRPLVSFLKVQLRDPSGDSSYEVPEPVLEGISAGSGKLLALQLCEHCIDGYEDANAFLTRLIIHFAKSEDVEKLKLQIDEITDPAEKQRRLIKIADEMLELRERPNEQSK